MAEVEPVMLPVEAVTNKMEGLGFERIEHIPGSTYKDNSTVIVIPTRGTIHHKVVQAWQGLMTPMNQKRGILFASGHEVGKAYDEMIKHILASPDLSKWKYIMTLEDDNLPPADAHVRLLETIEWGKYDAVSGIYFTKGPVGLPMAYGDPKKFRDTGVLEFGPRDIRQAISQGTVMEVNGIACGCALWRMDLFRELQPPWFVTVSDVIPEKGPMSMTQDLYFCQTAKRAGKTFAVDMRVRVGHMDIESGIVY